MGQLLVLAPSHSRASDLPTHLQSYASVLCFVRRMKPPYCHIRRVKKIAQVFFPLRYRVTRATASYAAVKGL